MKRLVLIALLLTAWATPLAAADKIIDRKQLVFRDDVAFEKFSTKPFTGIATGWRKPPGKDGKRGLVYQKKVYVNGLGHGPDQLFCVNGQLRKKGQWKKGLKVGKWLSYDWCDGRVSVFMDWSTGEHTVAQAKHYFRYPDNDKVKSIYKNWLGEGGYVARFIHFLHYDRDGNVIAEERYDKVGNKIYEFPKK